MNSVNCDYVTTCYLSK